MVVSIDGFGQRKKKNPYEGYWEQQEKQEQFDKIAKEALVLFQAKKYENAKNKYSAALKIIPTDQRVIAKIRDIDLLIEKQKHAQMQQQSFTPEHTIEESKEEEEEEEELATSLCVTFATFRGVTTKRFLFTATDDAFPREQVLVKRGTLCRSLEEKRGGLEALLEEENMIDGWCC